MKLSCKALTLAVALGPWALAQEDRAVPREGGQSHGSSAGAAHHSSGSSSSSDSSSAVSQGGAGNFRPTDAQRRHPRAGTGTGWRYPGGRGDGGVYWSGDYWNSGYYGRAGRYYYYDPYFYGGYWGWYSPYYYSGFYGYPSYYGWGGRYASDRTASLRLMVQPRQARVYVDGYYAGVADDFDGIFQRLNVSPGRHEVTFKLEGYATHKVKVYAPLGQTLKIRHEMARGSASTEDVVGDPADEDRWVRNREENAAAGAGEIDGIVRLEVTPEDASVYIDGDFRGTARELGSVRLPAGRHRIELVRPGYRTEERDVELRGGGTETLALVLGKS
jgi:hypothetical protein